MHIADRAVREVDASQIEAKLPPGTGVERAIDHFGSASKTRGVDEPARARVVQIAGRAHQLKHATVTHNANPTHAREARRQQVGEVVRPCSTAPSHRRMT